MEGSKVLEEQLYAIFLAASFGFLVSWIAWKKGYYSLPKYPFGDHPLVRRRSVLIAFGIFLTIAILIAPGIYVLWNSLKQGSFTFPKDFNLSPEFHGWMNLFVIGSTASALMLFFQFLKKPEKEGIWGISLYKKNYKQNVKDFLMGSLTWLIAYPWIIVIGQILALLIALLYSGPLPDQAAVKHLKDLLTHPVLFFLTAVTVVSIVPFVEELLFRGFLQSWLKRMMSPIQAIILTSFIFAMFHFSSSQGIENIEFISALFLLSCYLGFIKERQQSLWASIGLHSTFNLISVLLIIF